MHGAAARTSPCPRHVPWPGLGLAGLIIAETARRIGAGWQARAEAMGTSCAGHRSPPALRAPSRSRRPCQSASTIATARWICVFCVICAYLRSTFPKLPAAPGGAETDPDRRRSIATHNARPDPAGIEAPTGDRRAPAKPRPRSAPFKQLPRPHAVQRPIRPLRNTYRLFLTAGLCILRQRHLPGPARTFSNSSPLGIAPRP
jgi:hypothetical protein